MFPKTLMFPRNRCMYGCPANSFCQFGFCECNPGLTKSMVRAPCFFHLSSLIFSTLNFPPWVLCFSSPQHFLISRAPATPTTSALLRELPTSSRSETAPRRPPARPSTWTSSATPTSPWAARLQSINIYQYNTIYLQGKCQCRTDMRWNTEAGECQVVLCHEVCCSSTLVL